MLIKEYRIPMPLSVEEYRIAQLYMVARFSRERTTKGEGIEVVVTEPFENENGKGMYTKKIIHLGSHLPAWAKAVVPVSLTQIIEEAWNAYPYVKNVYSCPAFGERLSIVTETRYFDDDGSQNNVHNLSKDLLAQREVEFIDIALDEIDPRYYKKEEDPTLYTSEKTKRGPLAKDWQKTTKPLMCIYKIAHVEFKMWGVQTKAEQWIQKAMVHDVVTLGHKQAFCWLDSWIDMSIEDIRQYEQETKEILHKIMHGDETGKTPSQPSTPATQKKEGEKTGTPVPEKKGTPAPEKKAEDKGETADKPKEEETQ